MVFADAADSQPDGYIRYMHLVNKYILYDIILYLVSCVHLEDQDSG